MKLKKKIIRDSYDYQAEETYYKEAARCPKCGNTNRMFFVFPPSKGMDDSPVMSFLTETGNRSYTCYRCGCQWEVKKFKQ